MILNDGNELYLIVNLGTTSLLICKMRVITSKVINETAKNDIQQHVNSDFNSRIFYTNNCEILFVICSSRQHFTLSFAGLTVRGPCTPPS